MAGKLVGTETTLTTAASTDYIPIVRPGDTTARHMTVASFAATWVDTYFVNVKDYGALGDGTTDDTAAIQAALNVAASGATGIQKGTVVVFPPGRYVVTSPLNLCNRSDMKLIGYGGMTYNTEIIGKCTGKAVIEMVGAQDITIEGIAIKGDATLTPAIGIWTARSTVNISTSRIYFRDIYTHGSFSLACYLNCGSESNHWDHCCTFPSNAGCDAGILFDYRNALSGITPDNATLNLVHDTVLCRIFNSYLTAASTATSFSPIYVYAGNAPYIENTYLVSWGAPVVYLRGGGSGLQIVGDLAVEGTPTYLLDITDDATYNTPGKVSRFHFEGIGNPTCSSGYAIYAANNTKVRDSTITKSGISNDVRFYDIEGCIFNKWGQYTNVSSPVMTIANDAIDSFIHINYSDSLVISGYSYNVIVDDESGAAPQPYQFVNKYLRVGGTYAAATLASISQILTASATWDVGSLADGASSNLFVALSGVAADGKWVCLASHTQISGTKWQMSAHPDSGGVTVTITNNTGGVVDLASGTLRVLAMKIA